VILITRPPYIQILAPPLAVTVLCHYKEKWRSRTEDPGARPPELPTDEQPAPIMTSIEQLCTQILEDDEMARIVLQDLQSRGGLHGLVVDPSEKF
jgi:hypothetical protein